jgi:hypothetical protein
MTFWIWLALMAFGFFGTCMASISLANSMSHH